MLINRLVNKKLIKFLHSV